MVGRANQGYSGDVDVEWYLAMMSDQSQGMTWEFVVGTGRTNSI